MLELKKNYNRIKKTDLLKKNQFIDGRILKKEFIKKINSVKKVFIH